MRDGGGPRCKRRKEVGKSAAVTSRLCRFVNLGTALTVQTVVSSLTTGGRPQAVIASYTLDGMAARDEAKRREGNIHKLSQNRNMFRPTLFDGSRRQYFYTN